uniref:Adhesion G protein-coupled receptor L3 n=1 Tax=Sinocyclocheilus rhinocerous TaxID=307959 RepID=A0A673ILV9_9TELE
MHWVSWPIRADCASFSRAPVPMAVVRRELSCESYPIELRCPGTDVIMIESANYGRTDDKICDADPAQMENTRCTQTQLNQKRTLHTTKLFIYLFRCIFRGFGVKVEAKIFICLSKKTFVAVSPFFFLSVNHSNILIFCSKTSIIIIIMFKTAEYGRPTTTYKLPHRVDGTGFVVYDGALFFNKERTRNIVKFDLRTRIKSGEAIIASANYHDTSPYRWGGKSDIDLSVDENGLWVIYATEQNNGQIVISQLNPYTLRVEGTWDTAYDKRSASNAFMICGILYVVKLNKNVTSFIHSLLLKSTATNNIYNPRDNLLYVWNNYHVVKYTLDFGVLDNRLGKKTSSSGNILMDTTTTRTTTRPVIVTMTTASTSSSTTMTSSTRSPSTTPAAPRSTTTDRQPAALPEVTARSDPSSVLPNIAVEFCSPVTDSSITWPKTRQGLVAKQPCPLGTVGTAVFTCQGPEGLWDQQGPDLSNCTSTWVNIINQKIRAGEPAAIISRELSEQTKGHMHAGDITYTVRAMGHLIDLLDVQLRNLTPGGKDSAARSLNKVLHLTYSTIVYVKSNVLVLTRDQCLICWRSHQLRAATMLLDTVEQGAFVLADNLLKTDVVQENTENIQLEVARMSTDGSLPDLKFPQTGGQGNTIHLSANTLKQHGRNGEIRMAFVLYKHLGSYLSTENASMKFSSETLNTNHSVIVNSPVITAAINKDSNKVYLSDPVIFTMRHIQQSEENFNPNCSFWSYSKRSMTGFWSTQDCRLLGTNRTHTTCSCTHLTNFAVLMAHVDVKVETKIYSVHDLLLDIITWVGILLSLVCLLVCIFTFCFFRGLPTDRNTIHKNLCISLFIAETLFLTGINRADQPIACAVFAALLHFFFLSAFTWMFLEGVQLYIMLVEVFESEHSRRRYFYLAGYGIPALIVAVSAAVDYHSYGTDRVCWLRLDTYFIWSFIGPATLIIMLNVIFLGIALYKMFHHTAILKPDTEYGKCLRTHCYSGKSVDSSVGSVKSSSSRGPGRYSSASQSRIRRMWNDTVRKQSESSFMAGDINSSATLNRGAMANHLIPNSLLRAHASNNPYNTLLGESAVYNNPTLSMYNAQEGILNNARDTSAMDTLPLNGNHGNSYSLASADYMSDCVQIIDRTYNVHKETTLEKRILKELTSNYLPTYLNNHDRTAEHGRNLMNKLVNEVSNGGGVKDSPMLPVNLALGLDDSASFPHEDSLGLELIREESNTPLLPPPRHVQPLPSTFSSASSSRRRLPQENSESFFPLLTEEQTEETPSPQRDSLYTSMPTLPDPERSDTHSLPRGGDTHMLPRSGEPDDVYYKSMPNLGSRNHLHQLHSYYQRARGSSDGFIVPPKDELSPEEPPPQETAHMVTSL